MSIKKHEDKYLHIPKKIILILFMPIYVPIWILIQLVIVISDCIIKSIWVIFVNLGSLIGGIFDNDFRVFNYKPDFKVFIYLFKPYIWWKDWNTTMIIMKKRSRDEPSQIKTKVKK